MGFSTTQIDVLEALVARMRAEGYNYYLCHQNLLSGVSNDYDLIVYFSKEEIFAETGYKYAIPSNSIRYYIRTGNASTNNNTDRFSIVELYNMQIINVSESFHISTNATFLTSSIQPDYCLEVNQYETQGGILFTLCVFLLFVVFTKLFRR